MSVSVTVSEAESESESESVSSLSVYIYIYIYIYMDVCVSSLPIYKSGKHKIVALKDYTHIVSLI